MYTAQIISYTLTSVFVSGVLGAIVYFCFVKPAVRKYKLRKADERTRDSSEIRVPFPNDPNDPKDPKDHMYSNNPIDGKLFINGKHYINVGYH